MWADLIASLKRNYFWGNSAYRWLRLVVLVALFSLICLLAKGILKKVLRRILKDREEANYLPRSATTSCSIIAVLTFALYLARLQLRYDVRVDVVLELLSKLSLIALVAMTIYWLVPPFVFAAAFKGKRTESANRRLDTLANFVVVLIRFFAILLGLFAVLSAFGINVSGVLAGVGLGGLAISLAAQDTLSNLISGVSILFDRPFQIGDFIMVEELSGTVEDIGLRSTRLRTTEDTIVVLPNQKITNSSVVNYSKIRRRRISLHLPLGRENEPGCLKELISSIEEYLKQNNQISREDIRLHLFAINAYDQEILVQCYVCSSDYDTFLLEQGLLLQFINEEMARLQLTLPQARTAV